MILTKRLTHPLKKANPKYEFSKIYLNFLDICRPLYFIKYNIITIKIENPKLPKVDKFILGNKNNNVYFAICICVSHNLKVKIRYMI